MLKIASCIKKLSTKIKTKTDKIKSTFDHQKCPRSTKEASKRFGKDIVMEDSFGSVNRSSSSAII